MDTADLLLALTAFAFVSSITPGPNNLMLLASGTRFGFARTVPHLLGVAGGFTLMIVLVGLGLVQLFQAFPAAYGILKWVSVAYLVYLAWKIATAEPLQHAPEGGSLEARPMTFVQAALFQWVNPKAWTMALTAVTAYRPVELGDWAVLAIAFIFGLVNLPSVSAWVVVGEQLRRFLTDRRKMRIFNVGAATLLLASLAPTLLGG